MDEERPDIGPFSGPPLCRKSEVVTYRELRLIHKDLVEEFEKMSWFKLIPKLQLIGAGAMLEGLLRWIEKGKD